MKLPALGRLEARLLAEVVSEVSGRPAPREGQPVEAFLESADPGHLLDAARHLVLRTPRQVPPALLEAIAVGAIDAPKPALHQLVLPEWRPQEYGPSGTLADLLRNVSFRRWKQEDVDPAHREDVRARANAVSDAIEAARKGGSVEAVTTAIEALIPLLEKAIVVPDRSANPWSPEYADAWSYRVDCAVQGRDDSLAALHRILSVTAPERSARFTPVPSGVPDPFDKRVDVGKPGTRVARDVVLAHELVAKLARGEPSLLVLSGHLADLAEGRPQPLSHFTRALELCAEHVLVESPDRAAILRRRLAAVLKAWPKPESRKDRAAELARAEAALARIAQATLVSGDEPLMAPLKRVVWSKGGTLHKVELEGGTFAYVRKAVDKFHWKVHPGSEVAVWLLHRALGSDRAPEAVRRRDAAGEVRTVLAEVPGYHSIMETGHSAQALLQGPHGDAAATVAFVDLITAAEDLHAANLGTDASGRMVAIDRELAFRPGADVPSYWGGVSSIRFPPSLIATARGWSLDDLQQILAPSELPRERVEEVYARLQKLLGSLKGTVHTFKRET